MSVPKRIDSSRLQVIPFLKWRDKRFAKWIEQQKSNFIDDKPEVLNYLQNAYCVSAVPGFERDPFNSHQAIAIAPNKRTDGTWVWVETIAYWVENYDLKLVPTFLAHIRELDYKPPKLMLSDFQGDFPWVNDTSYFEPKQNKGTD